MKYNNFSLKSEHPSLLANKEDILKAKEWIKKYSWYDKIFQEHKTELDRFISHGPIYVSPIKQIYEYNMYKCPKHKVDLIYEEFLPHEHYCPVDKSEVHTGFKHDSAWSGWYNHRLANYLYWSGILYQIYNDEKYAEAGKEILLKFADLYLKYPTDNTILGPAHVFFGTLSESFWGVYMTYGYDLLYDYKGFNTDDKKKLKENLFIPLAKITQQFPESASNRQLWYNNVSAAVGFLYNDQELIDFAIKGKYGFEWQLGSALPEGGFWAEGPGYHYVTLRGMIHLAEMAKRHGFDLYSLKIAGRTMKKMFDAPFEIIKPNYEFPRIKDSGGGNILEYASFYEVGYSVYKDPKYLWLLNRAKFNRGKQIVGMDSGLGEKNEPITLFNLIPDLPEDEKEIYPGESSNLKENGLGVLRNEYESHRNYLFLDYGLLGGEHGHPDRLQIEYYAAGKNWIVDPLNEDYFNPNLQTWYRQTIAHNTIVLDQTTQTWANGYYNFFDAMESIQVVSGGSETIYPGAILTRTLLQVEDYFIDIFDIHCKQKRLIDWPVHSFGELDIEGVNLKKQPIDYFGHQPGIPGYDQLTEIYTGKTDGPWTGLFDTKDGKFLMIKTLGDKSTEIFKTVTPPIGGFYKQMVTDKNPLQMLFSRRFTDATRFTSLFHAYEGRSDIRNFKKCDADNKYIIEKTDADDILFADVDKNVYWMIQKVKNSLLRLAGFNLKEIEHEGIRYFSSKIPIQKFECRIIDSKLIIKAPNDFIEINIYAPGIDQVEMNGKVTVFKRAGDFIKISQTGKLVIEIDPGNNKLFSGEKYLLPIRIWNLTDEPFSEKVKFSFPDNWEENTKSQLEWWGGIVNLIATNKGPIEQKVFPSEYRMDSSWIEQLTSESISIKPYESEVFEIPIKVPNDIPKTQYNISIGFGKELINRSFYVTEPVSAAIIIPNGEKETLWINLKNNTEDFQKILMKIRADKNWDVDLANLESIQLSPLENKKINIPIKLVGYNPDNQLYPISLIIESGDFKTEIKHDFYSGVVRYTKSPPSLEGDWTGWEKNNPLTIDKASQVCRLLMGNQPWKGLEDLSAKIYTMYDETYLYIGAEVMDDIIITHFDFPRMSYPWDTDSMEIVLDTRKDYDQGTDPPTPGLFRHLCLAEYRITEFGADKWQGGSAGGPTLPKPNLIHGAETYFDLSEKGYNMICRIPLNSLKNVIAEPGYKVGFDVAINDNDGTTYRKNQHIWAGFNQNQSWWDMGTIGNLIFGDK